jgi:integrase
MNQAAKEILENHPRTESDFVFPGRSGGQRTRYPKAIDRIREKAGLPPGFRPVHGLRHLFATQLASSGRVDLYVLQRLLTHQSPQMTMRYSHLRDQALRRASDLAGDLLGQVVKGNQRKVVNVKE